MTIKRESEEPNHPSDRERTAAEGEERQPVDSVDAEPVEVYPGVFRTPKSDGIYIPPEFRGGPPQTTPSPEPDQDPDQEKS
jgi:hypothetical protein